MFAGSEWIDGRGLPLCCKTLTYRQACTLTVQLRPALDVTSWSAAGPPVDDGRGKSLPMSRSQVKIRNDNHTHTANCSACQHHLRVVPDRCTRMD